MRLVIMPHFMPPRGGERYARTIVRVETLCFDHAGGGDGIATFAFHLLGVIGRALAGGRCGKDPDASIGQYAVHVEENDLDAPCAFFSEIDVDIISEL
jgi:hypothetical protein